MLHSRSGSSATTGERKLARSAGGVWVHFLPECKNPIITGKQTASTRKWAFAGPGSVFYAFGKKFLLEEVVATTLDRAAKHYYLREGVNTVREFVARWEMLAGSKRWNPDEVVYVHLFRSLN